MNAFYVLLLAISATYGQEDYIFTEQPPLYIIGDIDDVVTFNCTANSADMEVDLLVSGTSYDSNIEGIHMSHNTPASLTVSVTISSDIS